MGNKIEVVDGVKGEWRKVTKAGEKDQMLRIATEFARKIEV